MTPRVIVGVATAALVTLLLGSAVTALTAANVVTSSRAGETSQTIDANDLKPAACNSIVVTNRVQGIGVITGTGSNDLITGSGVPDAISALGGDDCIQGAGGDDSIDGGPGSDVCLGGPGTDSFVACETEVQ
ncbi:MAG: calcium-binding protein [Actinomycetota bacterium]